MVAREDLPDEERRAQQAAVEAEVRSPRPISQQKTFEGKSAKPPNASLIWIRKTTAMAALGGRLRCCGGRPWYCPAASLLCGSASAVAYSSAQMKITGRLPRINLHGSFDLSAAPGNVWSQVALAKAGAVFSSVLQAARYVSRDSSLTSMIREPFTPRQRPAAGGRSAWRVAREAAGRRDKYHHRPPDPPRLRRHR